ncbi:hypothetical protein GF324_04345, partial [bacterium]|nr:hypothetical protein [bacterium]
MCRRNLFLVLFLFVFAGTSTAENTLAVQPWLSSTPIPVPHALIDETEDFSAVETLLGTPPVDPGRFWPAAGEEYRITPTRPITMGVPANGQLAFQPLPVEGST